MESKTTPPAAASDAALNRLVRVGDLPAPITNPEAWPTGYADGFNDYARHVDQTKPAQPAPGVGGLDAELVCAEYGRLVNGSVRFTPNEHAVKCMRQALQSATRPAESVAQGGESDSERMRRMVGDPRRGVSVPTAPHAANNAPSPSFQTEATPATGSGGEDHPIGWVMVDNDRCVIDFTNRMPIANGWRDDPRKIVQPVYTHPAPAGGGSSIHNVNASDEK